MNVTIDMPGAFETFWTGTGVAQGQVYVDDDEALEAGAKELRHAYDVGKSIRRGRGYSMRLTLTTPEAVEVLRDYADVCISSNLGGDVDYAEVRAARALVVRCNAALKKMETPTEELVK